ncbi:MAG: ABC transporter ATP-binding protein, partial [Lachnospiraceae bacterium]|nr:ABC transporter ATP-binding protein [Lachnospiraceae bacterium]
MRDRRGGKREKPRDTKGTLLRALRYVSNYSVPLIIVLVLCLISNLLSLKGPDFAGEAIAAADAGAGKVDFDKIYYYAGCMLAVYVSSSILTLSIHFIMMNISRHIAKQMRSDVFHKLMKLPVKYFDRHAAGDIMSRVSYDIDVVSTCISTDIVHIMTSVVTIVGSFFMMLAIAPPLMVVLLVTIPLTVMYTRGMAKKTRPRYSKRSAAYGKLNGFVEEMFSGQKTILAYAQEDTMMERFDVINEEACDAFYQAECLGKSIGPTVGMFNNLGLALTGMFGSILYLYQVISLKQFSTFVLRCNKFSRPINEISNVTNEIFSALAAAERVFRLLDEEEELHDILNAYELKDVRGDVDLKDVSFGYLPEKRIIHDFDIQAEAGKMIAIVGPTGAGKTTIINLLMRFYDPDEGEIFVDGHEIRSVTRKSLRRSYAMVLQDTWLFNGTIFDNIAYGKEGATMEEVIAVAKAARIHHTIMQLPQGYNTIIGEDGGNISKGQKQLLTIARAMLYNAKMLIL